MAGRTTHGGKGCVNVPSVSVIVPTRNRRASLLRLLQRLAEERDDPGLREIVIVDDGSTDDTVQSAGRTGCPVPLRVVQQSHRGAAIARNAGARVATGDVLLFLDDDVEPEPGVIAAHAAAHEHADDIVGLGDLPPRTDDRTYFGVMVRRWWLDMRAAPRTPGHRHAFTDLLSGHFSIRRTQFERLGGFDERLRCREDYELGYRIIQAGLQMRFLPNAVATHHDSTGLAKSLRRKFEEGIADVQLFARHPAIGCCMPLAEWDRYSRSQRIMIRLVWSRPLMGRAVARLLQATLPVLERTNRRARWRGVLHALLTYWYWRGVASKVRSYEALLEQIRSGMPPRQEPRSVDLSAGFESIEASLDRERPGSIRIDLGPQLIGEIRERPGEEGLRAAHLRRVLATTLRTQYLAALAATRRVPATLLPAAAALTGEADSGHNRASAS